MNSLQVDNELAVAIRALGDVFIARMPAILADMRTQLRQGDIDPEPISNWQHLHRQLHSIAGSAGSFGYAELGLNARSLELQLEVHLKSGDMTTASTRAEFMAAMDTFIKWVTLSYIASATGS